jgi:hypothetical protein
MAIVAGAPIASADITAVQGYTTGKPLVRLVASATQSLPFNTATALTFTGSEDIDTHNFHDPVTNSSRVTPTIAGYYTARGTVFHGSRTDYSLTDAWVRKNGATNLAPSGRHSKGTTASQADTAQVTVLVQFNGTTDYVELVAIQQNGASAAQVTNQSSQFSSVFELVFERPL